MVKGSASGTGDNSIGGGMNVDNIIDHAEFVAMETKGIVVIAVVVCVVGTSCIWVLVIYVKTRLRGNGGNVNVMAKFETSGGSSGSCADSRSQSSAGARSSLVGRGSTGSTSGGTSGGSHSHVQQQQHHHHNHFDGKRHHRSPSRFAPGSYDETASSPVAPLAWNYGGDIPFESRTDLRRHSSSTINSINAASAPQYIVGGGCGETFSKGSEMELLDTISPESLIHQRHLQQQQQQQQQQNKPPLRVAEDTSKFSHHGAVTVHVLRQEANLATVGIRQNHSSLPPPSPQQLRRTAPPSPLPPLHRLAEEGSSLNRFDTSLQSSIDVPSASTQVI